MNDSTRRGFLAMTGAGVAAVGAAAVVPGAFASERNDSPERDRDSDGTGGPAAEGPLVAHVNDLSTGEVSVMVGEHEVTVVDRDLANKIARLSRKGA